jgi:lipopolysaccharide/colanic/teichoic acid biosynthesis glycosyltransferase
MPTSRLSRPLDLLIGTVLSILTLPAVAMLGVVSLLTFRTWPFFTQERVGRHGDRFRLVKIRSLPPATPTEADKYAIARVDNPRVARFMREHHLDELPQLWLVVRGHMSLVGPRPEMPALTQTYDPTFVEIRNRVRPGCTGVWQLSCDAGGLIGEAPEYDLWYVAHRSVRLDLWIMGRTFGQALGVRPSLSTDELRRWPIRTPLSTPVPGGPMSSGEVTLSGPTFTSADSAA